MDEVERNPFTLPSDEEVFKLRDEDKQRRADERERQHGLKVWQKTTTGQLTGGAQRLKELMKGTDVETTVVSKKTRQTRDLVTEAKTIIANDRRQEKENMAEFIAKKREMFLVQMSLDTKREEIRKLEEKAQMKEEALKKSEQMLEEDAIRFDTFLKENDKKAHEAIKKAERETKLKTDKVQEIKKLNQQIQMVQSDMSKHKEALEDCLKYKDFLDSLTPPEFVEEKIRIKRENQEKRRQYRILKRRQAYEAEVKRIKDEHQALLEAEAAESKGKKKRREAEARPPPKIPQPPNFENEPTTSSGEELPMYFTHPNQLLDIFTALEEQNLFLIQNSQETEQALEELKQTFNETRASMDKKSTDLQANVNELQQQIGHEDGKAGQLRKRIQASGGGTQGRQEQLLALLHSNVREVYERCGFDAGSKPNTLFMLSELEARLEDLLNAIEQMPEEYVIRAEKEKEKKRRERKRQEQQALQDKQQEERNRKSIERSMQPAKTRNGRQVMFRSAPVRRAVREEKKEEEEDQDEIKHLS